MMVLSVPSCFSVLKPLDEIEIYSSRVDERVLQYSEVFVIHSVVSSFSANDHS